MNEATSIFMTMIESTLNKMIDARIEAKMAELNARLKVVEALEEQLTSAITLLDTAFNAKQPATTATLDLQSEEFRLSVIKIIDQQVMEDTFLDPLVEAVTDSDKFNDAVNSAAQEAARSEVEEAISDHCGDFDHDDIHQLSDHETNEDAVTDIIKEVLNNVTVTLKI
jgi:hypothetical protein